MAFAGVFSRYFHVLGGWMSALSALTLERRSREGFFLVKAFLDDLHMWIDNMLSVRKQDALKGAHFELCLYDASDSIGTCETLRIMLNH